MRKKNGEYLVACFKGCIAYSPEGKFLRTHCVFEDITEEKECVGEMSEQSPKENILTERIHTWKS